MKTIDKKVIFYLIDLKNGLDIKYNSSYGKISDALDQDGLYKDNLIHGKLR